MLKKPLESTWNIFKFQNMYDWVEVSQIVAQLWVHLHLDHVEFKVLNIFLASLLPAISAKVSLKWLVPHSFQESNKRQKGAGVLGGCKLFGNSPRLPYPSPSFSFCFFWLNLANFILKMVFFPLLTKRFWQIFWKISRFFYWVLACRQKCKGVLKFLLLSYVIYIEIWLNLLVDDRHFGYITKLGKTKTLLDVPMNSFGFTFWGMLFTPC
jgi:hypothetical protein